MRNSCFMPTIIMIAKDHDVGPRILRCPHTLQEVMGNPGVRINGR